MNNRARGTLLASILVLGAAGCGDAELRATEVGTQRQALTTADRVLGFESVSTDWALAPGSSGTLSASTQHTEGAVSAQIAGLGWAQLQSTVLIGPLGTTSTNATFDLMVLGSGTIPWGDVVLQVQSSDLAVNEQIGQKLLGGTSRGVFQTVTLPLSSTLQQKLSSSSYDGRARSWTFE